MNIKPLFKRFDELADAPERIPALRKVILAYLLHSAVNSRDAISRAATLREAHEIRRRQLIKNVSRKEVPTVPEVTDEDLPPSLSDIPTVLFDRLGNITSIEKGLSQIQSTTPGKYPLVVTAETRSSSESFDFEGAAAIIPLVSSTGHGDASLKRLHYQEGRYAVGNILAVVKPICPDLLRARFIYEYLSAFKEELLVSRMVGTANVSLTVNKLKEVPVPLVSGPVLSRIDELMALCDRLEAQQQERETRHAALARASLARFADAPTPANLPFLFHPSYAIPPADLRKSILTLAVQGKLVPQDPNDEPAEELLKRIAAEQECLVKARQIRRLETAPLNEDEEPFEIPSNWAWTRLGQIGDWGSGSTPPRGNHELYGGGIAWLKSGELNDNRMLASSEETVTELAVKTCSFRLNKPGDVLLAMYGATIGKAAILVEPAVTNQAVCGCTPFPGVLNTYLFDYLLSQRDAFHAASEGGAQPNISKVKIVGYLFPLPPLAEQRRIVSKVDQLMALVDALETQLAASRATATNLLSALVAELTGTIQVVSTSASSPLHEGP
jgi:type I restriction enzyme S subunit